MFKCDAKLCNQLTETAHQIVINNKQYDFCDQCYKEFINWIETALNEGLDLNSTIKFYSTPSLQSPYYIDSSIVWTTAGTSIKGYNLSTTAQPTTVSGVIFPSLKGKD